MSPFEFLQQEFENVKEALDDSLRHDYGPGGSADYYQECSDRLDELKKASKGVDQSNQLMIAEKLEELDVLANWISLIERSHLGEFSWPFANTLRTIATELLGEVRLKGPPSKPVVHIIGAGEHYDITTEGTISATTKKRRFVIVGFPRSLKQHVLLHSLFGHELGHAVIHSGAIVDLLAAFVKKGTLSTPLLMTNWLHLPSAPQAVRDVVAEHKKTFGKPVIVDKEIWFKWITELACDLFGLVLFGPAFAAATFTYLKYREKHPYLSPITQEGRLSHHPPYACRHRLLTNAMQVLGWDRPITKPSDSAVHAAEKKMLGSIVKDGYDKWATLLEYDQISEAAESIKLLLNRHSLNYNPPSSSVLVELVKNLADRVPPVSASLVAATGETKLAKVDLAQVLYAGWVYWLGKGCFAGQPIEFLQTNKFCHMALIHNDAIRKTLEEPKIRHA